MPDFTEFWVVERQTSALLEHDPSPAFKQTVGSAVVLECLHDDPGPSQILVLHNAVPTRQRHRVNLRRAEKEKALTTLAGFFSCLLIHEGSRIGVSTRNSNPAVTSSGSGSVPRVDQTTGSVYGPSLRCQPNSNSASTQSQQPV